MRMNPIVKWRVIMHYSLNVGHGAHLGAAVRTLRHMGALGHPATRLAAHLPPQGALGVRNLR
jgi:hypothetical protein